MKEARLAFLILMYSVPYLDEKRRLSMFQRMLRLLVAVSATGMVVVSNAASAMPNVDPLAIKNATGTNVETVWGRGFGWGLGAGFLGGAIIGGALAAPYYRYGYGYPRWLLLLRTLQWIPNSILLWLQ
jgi:hypothetical protein